MSHQTHQTHTQADPESVEKIRDLVKDAKVCMLTSVDDDGSLVARPMATQEIEFDGAAWFFAAHDAPKIAEIEKNPHVNAAYSEGSYVSMSGHAEIVREVEKKKELWNDVAGAWLQGGPESDEVVLIKIVPDTVEYWDTPSTPSTLIGVVKAKVTGEQPDGGENKTIDL